MNKPLIGIIPLIDIERESYWMLPGYMKGIEEAGGTSVMLPLTSDKETLRKFVNYFDGFLFTGGHDVSPSLYREEVSDKCGECCPKRDEMETILLPMVLEQDKPVLGICRGLQLINAALEEAFTRICLPSIHLLSAIDSLPLTISLSIRWNWSRIHLYGSAWEKMNFR